jgi:flagellar M-ring protein FliF
MKLDLAAVFEQILSFYTKLPLAQKVALPLLLVGSMGVIIFISNWATRPDYRVLYSNLEEADAAGVVEVLKDKKIGYRLNNDGRTIEVTPAEIVHELRLELASMGVPKGGNVGFELFNEPKLGQSSFSEQINYIRSLQGELERTISTIDAVKAVRVHVTKPKPSVFAKRNTPPTASVLLRIKAGRELENGQVVGIANLVAGSVEGLTIENVNILNQNGKLLNEKPGEDDLSTADNKQLEYQRNLERSYVKRIESMLSEILGAGSVVARVTADLDFNRFEKEEEAYDPAATVTRSERTVSESQGLTAQGGVPGVLSNLTNDPGILTPPDSSENANIRSESVRNFEISRAVSRMVSAPGKIQKLSVAVLVDGQYSTLAEVGAGAGTEASGKRVYQPLSAEMLKKIENLVKQAVGFDPTRGDEVTVENMRFATPDETLVDALNAAEYQGWWNLGFQYGLPALLMIMFMLILVKPLVNFLVSPSDSEVDLSRLLPAGIEELEAELEAERSKLSVLPERNQPAVDIEELEQLLSENSRMVKDNPQQAALLIRYWLNDGRI